MAHSMLSIRSKKTAKKGREDVTFTDHEKTSSRMLYL